MELDPIEVSAQMTANRVLLRGMYALLFNQISKDEADLFCKEVIDSCLYNMAFQTDDGDIGFQLQSRSAQICEEFFAKVRKSNASSQEK